MVAFDVVRCSADNFKIAHDCILCFFVIQESNFVCVCQLTVYALNRFENMPEVIGDAKSV